MFKTGSVESAECSLVVARFRYLARGFAMDGKSIDLSMQAKIVLNSDRPRPTLLTLDTGVVRRLCHVSETGNNQVPYQT